MKEKIIYALGFFDGVHLGHQTLLCRCRELAEQSGCKAGVVTFSSHPDALVQGRPPVLINTQADRKRLLRQYNIGTVLELPFDKALMEMPWQEFVRLLIEEHGAGGFVCGTDFRFGNRGEGTAALLRQVCENAGIPCAVVPEQSLDGIRVSSTHIRTLLERGELENANRFLGHPHLFTGEVVTGRQLGRTIGIPTANLLPPDGVVQLPHGVYACKAHTPTGTFLAVTNIGSRPTVGGTQVTIEPWLLDFEGDLYGQTITLEFFKFLRPEQRFSALEDLKAQIQADAAQTRQLL